MPIYEYKCRKCANEFELLVLSKTVIACPECQGQDLEQLLSGFAVDSASIRQASAKASRRAQINHKDYVEKNIAHAEYVKKHDD